MRKTYIACLMLFLFALHSTAQIYPPEKQLVFDVVPTVTKPGYLERITDPTYNSTVVRITDQSVFDKKHAGLKTYHHYAKDQAWNSDGSLICLTGHPAAILDGRTFEYKKNIMPPAGPFTWSNTQPNIIYGTDGKNSFVKVDVNTNKQSVVKSFPEYDLVSFGEYEGNLSNDDGNSRGVYMIRIDNGIRTYLLGDDQMSWYIHVSGRNLDRPGWAYITEFADENTEETKPNFQKIFAVKLNPNANNDAITETFAHVHHSDYVEYKFSPFGIPNRDGSKVMFRSDWMGGEPDSEINSYVAFKPSLKTEK